MKYRSTLLLAGLLLALCVGYAALQRLGDREQRRAVEAKRVFGFAEDAVRTLEIQRLDEGPSTAARDEDGVWRFVKPDPAIVAFQPLWDRVARRLSELSNERTITESPGDLAPFGLEEPALTLRARAGDEEITLAFGRLEPTETYRYAQVNGGLVFLTTKEQYFELNRRLEDLRDKFLVDDRGADMLRFEFARIWTGAEGAELEDPPEIGDESTPVVIERSAAAAPWRLMSPLEAPANNERVNELVGELQFATGWGYIDDPEDYSDYGLSPPTVRVTMTDVNGVPTTLYFGRLDMGGGKAGLFTMRADRPAVFLVDSHVLTLFPESPETYRERRLLTRRASEIQRLHYVSAVDEFTLEKDPERGWRIVQPAYPDSEQRAISGYLSLLRQAEASSFPQGAPADFGLDYPDASITLTFASGENGVGTPEADEIEIRISEYYQDEEFYAVTQEGGAIGLVHKDSFGGLMTDSSQFRSKELMRFSGVDAVRLTFDFEGEAYEFEKVHGRWLVRAPENKRLSNQSDVATLLGAFSGLRAVASSDPGTRALESKGGDPSAAYGFDAPVLTMRVTVGAPDNLVEHAELGPLTVGRVARDNMQQRYALAEGREGVFRVDQALIETVREALRGVVDRGG